MAAKRDMQRGHFSGQKKQPDAGDLDAAEHRYHRTEAKRFSETFEDYTPTSETSQNSVGHDCLGRCLPTSQAANSPIQINDYSGV